MEEVDHIIIGAGVIGLTIARQLCLSGQDCLILDEAKDYGTVTSARNSEVIHAGIYYPEKSLKAKFCGEGKKKLYEFCQTYSVPHKNIGKYIVASDQAGLEKLEGIVQKANANGVNDLIMLDPLDILEKEPALSVVGSLYSPSTGIIDSHAFMQTLLGHAENAGAILSLQSKVIAIQPKSHGFILSVEVEGNPFQIRSKGVINAAGLGANAIAQTIDGLAEDMRPKLHLCKGNYFALTGKAPFSHLIYPVPVEGGLGVHLTLDMAGQARFGPDTEWVDHIDYDVDASRMNRMIEAIASYWPDIRSSELSPTYAGIRPKLLPQGAGDSDFRLDFAKDHGFPGLVNLFGIESPGLTSALAIADYVVAGYLEDIGG